ncbi:MAG: transposase-like protein [Planctomycetota bacterium]|jgi:transposase-like protein
MFRPPRCPNPSCTQHWTPAASFCWRVGYYQPRCRNEPVPRFRCKSCRRGFSRQTFRHDYRDRRPECNELLFSLLTSGVSLRQSGRLLKLGVQSVQRKMWKLSKTLEGLHENLSVRLPTGRTYLMDEEETFEHASIRPLTMPVVIERSTWFIVSTSVGSIRRLAPEGTARRRRQMRDERKHGRRPDQSARCVRTALAALRRRVSGPIVLQTDKKSSYPRIAKRLFGDRLRHETTVSTRARDTSNPLFPINTTLAMTRDNCGRLRRKSWLVSKKGERLQAQMALFIAYRNYIRPRFNVDQPQETPAVLLRLLPRPLQPSEAVRWRQDWCSRSPHPMSLLATARSRTPEQPRSDFDRVAIEIARSNR